MDWSRSANRLSRRAALRGGAALLVLSGCAGMTAGSGNVIEVRAPLKATAGTLDFAGLQFACMLGRSGIVDPKFEGDGGTPAGEFPLREVRYRADRLSAAPATGLPVITTRPSDGWCDDPQDAAYNRLVTLPHATDAEKLWRDDRAYDLLAVIGYNDAPVLPGRGSAIFLHVARTDDGGRPLPTSGCISLPIDNLLAVLARCTPSTRIRIATA